MKANEPSAIYLNLTLLPVTDRGKYLGLFMESTDQTQTEKTKLTIQSSLQTSRQMIETLIKQ